MDKEYIKPELKVQLFKIEDVITESSATSQSDLDSSADESDFENGDEV